MEELNNKNNKKTAKKKGRFLKYVAVSVASAVIGGIIFSGAALFILPNTSFFKSTALYKTLSSMNSSPNNAARESSSGSSGEATALSSNGSLTVQQVVKKVSPAIVGVSTKSIEYNESDLYSYFYGGGNGAQEVEGMGTGIIFSKEGYIVTNYHVIKGASTIKIILNSGKEVNAKTVNSDQKNDIAVLKVTDNVTMPGVAEFGDSSGVQVGDSVIAIGNPLGKELLGSVTTGIISAMNRSVDVENNQMTSLIQTDAAINPGNSGGPLLNMKGQVIGINCAKYSQSGYEGLGFAIPINTVKEKIPNLTKPSTGNNSGSSTTTSGVTLGVTVFEVNDQMAKQYDVPVGVGIDSVQSGSAADKAGMQKNDIIVKVDGTSVQTTDQLKSILSKHKSGDKIKVTIVRDGGNMTLNVTL